MTMKLEGGGTATRQEQRDSLRWMNDGITQKLLELSEKHNLSSQFTSEDGDASSSDTLSDDEKLMKPDEAFKKLLTNIALQPSMPKQAPKEEEQKEVKEERSDSGVTLSEIGSKSDLLQTADS